MTAKRLLDQAVPSWDVHEVHQLEIAASTEAAWRAIKDVTPLEVRMLAPLMGLRMLPSVLSRRPRDLLQTRTPLIDSFLRNGFAVLGERPGRELAVGGIGRFWRLRGNYPAPLAESPDAFAAFDEPLYAKGAMDLRVEPSPGGCIVRTETRVATTDREAERLFRRYWRIVMPGSALIRISWLNAIRRRALRAPARRAASA